MNIYRSNEALSEGLTQLGGVGGGLQKNSILFQGTTTLLYLETPLFYLKTCDFTIYFKIFLVVVRDCKMTEDISHTEKRVVGM